MTAPDHGPVRWLALAGALISVLALPGLFFAGVVPIFAEAPCAEEGVHSAARMAAVFAFLASLALCLFALAWPRARLLVAAAALPALALSAYGLTAAANRERQTACPKWTPEQAADDCRADLSHYVVRRADAGLRMTLVSPDGDSRAHFCLQRWARYQGSVEIDIADAVYAETRRRADAALDAALADPVCGLPWPAIDMAALDDLPDPPGHQMITIDADGRIFWNGANLEGYHGRAEALRGLDTYLGALAGIRPRPVLVLQLEAGAPCRIVDRVRASAEASLDCAAAACRQTRLVGGPRPA